MSELYFRNSTDMACILGRDYSVLFSNSKFVNLLLLCKILELTQLKLTQSQMSELTPLQQETKRVIEYADIALGNKCCADPNKRLRICSKCHSRNYHVCCTIRRRYETRKGIHRCIKKQSK